MAYLYYEFESKQYIHRCKNCSKTFKSKTVNKNYCYDEKCEEVRKKHHAKIRNTRLREYNKNGVIGSRKSLANELKEKEKNAYTYTRKCLKCDETFKTINKNIHLCDKCHNTNNIGNRLVESDFSNGINCFATIR